VGSFLYISPQSPLTRCLGPMAYPPKVSFRKSFSLNKQKAEDRSAFCLFRCEDGDVSLSHFWETHGFPNPSSTGKQSFPAHFLFDSPYPLQKRNSARAFTLALAFCAGRENRTPVSSLARTHSTTKPYPQIIQLSVYRFYDFMEEGVILLGYPTKDIFVCYRSKF
jgi:hypothetical protein